MSTATPTRPAAPDSHTIASHGEEHHDEHAHHGVGHVVEPRILILTALALLVLTAITVSVTYIDLGEMNIFIALGIAVLKGSLVCMFFMHLWWDRPFNSFVLVISLSLVALFIGFALIDTGEYQPDLKAGEARDIQPQIDTLRSEALNPAAHE